MRASSSVVSASFRRPPTSRPILPASGHLPIPKQPYHASKKFINLPSSFPVLPANNPSSIKLHTECNTDRVSVLLTRGSFRVRYLQRHGTTDPMQYRPRVNICVRDLSDCCGTLFSSTNFPYIFAVDNI